jgi:hypothetical protein
MEDRKNERDGLAGPGVGAADDVVAAERDRDHGALYGRGFLEAADGDPFEQRRFESERVERNRRGIVLGLRAIRALRPVGCVERGSPGRMM